MGTCGVETVGGGRAARRALFPLDTERSICTWVNTCLRCGAVGIRWGEYSTLTECSVEGKVYMGTWVQCGVGRAAKWPSLTICADKPPTGVRTHSPCCSEPPRMGVRDRICGQCLLTKHALPSCTPQPAKPVKACCNLVTTYYAGTGTENLLMSRLFRFTLGTEKEFGWCRGNEGP